MMSLFPALKDEEGNIISPEHTESHPLFKSGMESEKKKYIPRMKRPEWVAVGMLGKLLIRDDGTCKVNSYCQPNDDGIATASDKDTG
ncbi:peptidase G2 autoproteolytic cleavage domain-containing protein [Ectobacillus funiculus]